MRSWVIAASAICLSFPLSQGCAPMHSRIQFDIEDQAYSIPKADVYSIVSKDAGGASIIVEPVGANYMLIADDKLQGSYNWQGNSYPLMRMINTHPSPDGFEVTQSGAFQVICRRNQEKQGCGFRIVDGQVVWTVVFDAAEMGDISALQRAASRKLSEYKGVES